MPDNVPSVEQATAEMYRQYYARKEHYRNDLLRNPGVLWQGQTAAAAVVRAFHRTEIDPSDPKTKLLYVGCGDGGYIPLMISMGFDPGSIYGLDVLSHRVEIAKRVFPNCRISCRDAAKLDEPDGSYQLVFESTMFLQMTDADLASRVAGEMLRVCKPGGHVVLSDWRYSKPGTDEYVAVNRKRITKLFDVGNKCQWVAAYRGSLVPPIGRPLSKYSTALYFLVKALFPFLCGHWAVVLRKND